MKLLKYAMVPINSKHLDDKLLVRRVLISYKTKKKDKSGYVEYFGTKIIATDLYFTDKKASHKYLFEDAGYQLLDANPAYRFIDKKLEEKFYSKKPYHYWSFYKNIQPIEFLSFSVEKAINKFLQRKELYR